MMTDQLIERLADRLAPVSKGSAVKILALGLGGGALVSFAIMLAWLGIRPDLATAILHFDYWMKFLYTLGFALFGFWTVERLARPGVGAGTQAGFEVLPFAALALVAAAQWMAAPEAEHMPMLMGGSHTVCPWRIVILGLPVFVGVLWSMKRLAPPRPMLAGAAAGLLAGATGAWIYAFHCDESSAVFVAVWYTFGIALVGLLGALVGRWSLRW